MWTPQALIYIFLSSYFCFLGGLIFQGLLLSSDLIYSVAYLTSPSGCLPSFPKCNTHNLPSFGEVESSSSFSGQNPQLFLTLLTPRSKPSVHSDGSSLSYDPNNLTTSDNSRFYDSFSAHHKFSLGLSQLFLVILASELAPLWYTRHTQPGGSS